MRRRSAAAARSRWPWVSSRGKWGARPGPDGGFDLDLPGRYMPSRHEDKLEEVATAVVGRIGWYVTADPAGLTASIIPSEPPTFPPVIPYPLGDLRAAQRDRTPFGCKLPLAGQPRGDAAGIDWRQQAFALVAGMPGAGKTLALAAIIAGTLAAGAELVLADLPAKALDYAWCKDMVRPGGWGCDSAEATVTALALVWRKVSAAPACSRRNGVVNWAELPPASGSRRSWWSSTRRPGCWCRDRTPAGIRKDHPLKVEVDQANILKAAMDRFINKIIAELRFVGIRLILSNQVDQQLDRHRPQRQSQDRPQDPCRAPNPSKQARTQAFNDETTVPQVPDNIRSDAAAAKGTGAAELDGSSPFVFKGFYANSDDYRAALLALGVPTTIQPEPTARQIAQHTDSLRIDTDDATDRARGRAGRSSRPDPIDPDAEPVYDDSGRPLRGAAAANARSTRLATRG